MANNPKIKDPAEAALSAVEEALKLDFGGPDDSIADFSGSEDLLGDLHLEPEEKAAATPVLPPLPQSSEAETRKASKKAEPAAPRRAANEDRRPANDDRASVGNLVFALQRRASSTPIWIALVLSIVWATIGGAIGIAMWGSDIAEALANPAGIVQKPHLIGLGISIALPVVFFFVMATMIRRAAEMRLVARAMTEVAIRLAEPESVAKEAVISVSQAIRREVTAMGDGVERALARASELEVMVHNEVASLERSYNDNELRIRSLVEELVSQREAIINNSERVRAAIEGAHKDFADEIAAT
ncbi:MAG TPA: antitoxin, partial [Kaistiaceae bacterium]|nr:antitoxin [Kaistiaceae bacterium]